MQVNRVRLFEPQIGSVPDRVCDSFTQVNSAVDLDLTVVENQNAAVSYLTERDLRKAVSRVNVDLPKL